MSAAAAPTGAARKRGRRLDSEFPTLEQSVKSKREKRLFIFGRGEEPDFARFLTIERTDDGSMKSISVFKVKRELKELVGNVKKIQPLNEGKILLIEINEERQASALLNMSTLAGKEVKVSYHEKMNKSKGLVACYGWTHIPSEELKQELKAFNISDVLAIKKKGEAGKMIDTGSYIVTFDSPNLPTEIDAWYYPLKVKVYIPNPNRCFKCQKYGHFGDKCRIQKKLCGLCLHDEHEGDCVHPHFCANCGSGEHLSWSRKCEVFKQQFEIMKIKVSKKISYYAAKQEFEAGRTSEESFAAVVAKTRARNVLRHIQQERNHGHNTNAERSEEDRRRGIAYPSPEFLQSLRKDQRQTEENSSVLLPDEVQRSAVDLRGPASSGAHGSTGNGTSEISTDPQDDIEMGGVAGDTLDSLAGG